MVKLFILKTETVFMLTCVDMHDMHYLIKNISIMFDKTHILSYNINITLTNALTKKLKTKFKASVHIHISSHCNINNFIRELWIK